MRKPQTKCRGNITISLNWGNDHDLEVDCDVTPYSPAVTFGPPENCCPQEGGDIEVLDIFLLHTVSKVEESNRYFVKRVHGYRRRKLPESLRDALAEDADFTAAIEDKLGEGE